MTQRFISFTWITSIVVAMVFFAFGVYFIFLHDYFKVFASFLSGSILFLPQLVYRYSHMKQWCSMQTIAVIECSAMVLISLNGVGAMRLYLSMKYFDMVLHIIVPMCTAFILAMIFGQYLQSIDKYSVLAVQFRVIPLTIFLMLLWELWEYSADLYFNTHMSGQEGEPFDTLYDIVAGIVSMGFVYIVNNRYLNSFLVWAHK